MDEFETKPGGRLSIKLDEGVAFIMTHKDGTRTLHVFCESGTLRVPEDVVHVRQITPTADRQFVGSSGSYVAPVRGGSGGAGTHFDTVTYVDGGGGGSGQNGAGGAR